MIYDIRYAIYRPRAKGMTLVEILVVIAIIALLASMVIGLAGGIGNQSKEKGLQQLFAMLETALQEYHDYWSRFPNPDEPPTPSAALYAQLHSTPTSRRILEKIDDSLIRVNPDIGVIEIYDPWRTVLGYQYLPGDTFPVLISAGPDGKFETPDDITNR